MICATAVLLIESSGGHRGRLQDFDCSFDCSFDRCGCRLSHRASAQASCSCVGTRGPCCFRTGYGCGCGHSQLGDRRVRAHLGIPPVRHRAVPEGRTSQPAGGSALPSGAQRPLEAPPRDLQPPRRAGAPLSSSSPQDSKGRLPGWPLFYSPTLH